MLTLSHGKKSCNRIFKNPKHTRLSNPSTKLWTNWKCLTLVGQHNFVWKGISVVWTSQLAHHISRSNSWRGGSSWLVGCCASWAVKGWVHVVFFEGWWFANSERANQLEWWMGKNKLNVRDVFFQGEHLLWSRVTVLSEFDSSWSSLRWKLRYIDTVQFARAASKRCSDVLRPLLLFLLISEANKRNSFIYWKLMFNGFMVLRKTRAREGGGLFQRRFEWFGPLIVPKPPAFVSSQGDADFAKRRRPELKIDCQDE